MARKPQSSLEYVHTVLPRVHNIELLVPILYDAIVVMILTYVILSIPLTTITEVMLKNFMHPGSQEHSKYSIIVSVNIQILLA